MKQLCPVRNWKRWKVTEPCILLVLRNNVSLSLNVRLHSRQLSTGMSHQRIRPDHLAMVRIWGKGTGGWSWSFTSSSGGSNDPLATLRALKGYRKPARHQGSNFATYDRRVKQDGALSIHILQRSSSLDSRHDTQSLLFPAQSVGSYRSVVTI